MMSCIRAKLEYLREHPELADKPGYRLKKLRRKGDPYNWFLLLVKQPQLAPPYAWWRRSSRLGDLPWAELLAAQPQFEEYCNFETMNRLEVVKLSFLAPDIFARNFPYGRRRDLYGFLTASELERLLRDVPQAAEELDMAEVARRLTPNNWLCLLAFQPQFEKYFDWSPVEKRPSPYWAYLLRRQPQFADHCDWEHLTGWQIRQILSRQPQFADRCDLELLSEEQWERLLWDQPQFAAKKAELDGEMP